MAKGKRVSENEKLADEIQMWALERGLLETSSIKSLLVDLKALENFNYWATIPPNNLLPISESSTLLSLRKWRKIFILCRNLLVFMPVTITWIAISEASSKFSDFTSKNSDSVVNFLQFWQDGFGFLNPVWRLSNVAFVDFLILVVIILLTLLIQLISNREESVVNSQVKNDDSARQALIRKIFDYMLRNQKVNLQTADKKLAQVLRDLGKSSHNLEQTSKELTKFSKELNKLSKSGTKVSSNERRKNVGKI